MTQISETQGEQVLQSAKSASANRRNLRILPGILETLWLGIRNLMLHAMRSLLTALGIIFGVAAVMTMVAIGKGGGARAIEQIKQQGADNIVLVSQMPTEEPESGGTTGFFMEYGLKRKDALRLQRTIPHLKSIVRVRELPHEVAYGYRKAIGKVTATEPQLLQLARLQMARGRFLSDDDQRNAHMTAVLGNRIAEELFGNDDPLNSFVRLSSRQGADFYQVVGILKPVGQLIGASGKTRDRDQQVFIPLSAAQERYGDQIIRMSGGNRESKRIELHEIYIQVDAPERVPAAANAVIAAMKHMHKKSDYRIGVPYELLRRAEAEQRNWIGIMGSIAGISLIVGGIGIMNIMLATITERTREIGIRRALGAKRRDIAIQFLIETTLLCVAGGVLGIGFGVILAHVFCGLLEYQTIIPFWSILLSFAVSASVGLLFGMYPAIRAANLDPIEALRHE